MDAIAVRDGAAFARAKGVLRLELETDNQELVKLWKNGACQRSRIAPIIREAREICLCFIDFALMFTSRSCNRVAYTLAKQASGEDRLGE